MQGNNLVTLKRDDDQAIVGILKLTPRTQWSSQIQVNSLRLLAILLGLGITAPRRVHNHCSTILKHNFSQAKGT